MEITLNKKDFLRALDNGGTFAGKSKTLPITDCVKIKMKGNTMRIISTDMENFVSYTTTMPINVEEEVSLCVNAKDLYNYTRLIKDEEFTMRYNMELITLKHKKGKSEFPTDVAETFPDVKSFGETTKVTIPSALLNNWIVTGKDFTSNDELRPSFCSIYFYCQDNELGVCSTSGQSLYWDYCKYDLDMPNFDFMLNKNAFNAVCKACQDNENIEIEIGETNIKFKGENVCILARRVESKFPTFKAILPKNNNIEVELDKQEFIDALNRCKLSANASSPTTKLEIKGMEMQVSCEDLDFAKKSTETMLVTSNGDITIGFNCDKLLTILNAMSTERIILSLLEPNRAMIVKNNDERHELFLLMPCLLN